MKIHAEIFTPKNEKQHGLLDICTVFFVYPPDENLDLVARAFQEVP